MHVICQRAVGNIGVDVSSLLLIFLPLIIKFHRRWGYSSSPRWYAFHLVMVLTFLKSLFVQESY